MDLRPMRNAAGGAHDGDGSASPHTSASDLGRIAGLDEPTFWQRHRGLRWALPMLVLGALAAGSTQFVGGGDNGSDALPATTPDALLAAVRTPTAAPYSGTLVSRLAPDLPQLSPTGDDNAAMTGSRSMRVWYGGPQQQRIAVLAATTESDVFRDGTDVWHWTTGDSHAVHSSMPAVPVSGPVPTSGDPLALSPQALTTAAIGAIDPSTTVTVGAVRTVADRAAYDLVITPSGTDTKIGSVHISIDGRRRVPLGVQVYARGEDTPAVDVAYTAISFTRPGDANFRFAPPTGVSVREARASGSRVSGTGWSSVYGYPNAAIPLTAPSAAASFVAVSGSWGAGQLFECDLMSMLITRTGTVYVGTVEPSALYAAAAVK